MVNLTSVLYDLITANHILHYHSVVDAYGHISVRSPEDASQFIMSGNRAPALVASPDDFVYYHVDNASSVDPDAPRGYIERYIHSEIFKRFRNVSCVIHAHAEDVMPYAISGVPMKPVFHLPGFLGEEVPVWDIETVYQPGEKRDLLVRNETLGASLASSFAAPENVAEETVNPDRKVVLMRSHGFTTQGFDIRTAVFRAVFTTTNARVQTSSFLLRSAFGGIEMQGVDTASWGELQNNLEPLTPEQAAAAESSNDGTIDRPWGLWQAEVESQPLYKNNGE